MHRGCETSKGIGCQVEKGVSGNRMEVKAGQRARIRKGLIQGRGFGNLKEGVTVVGRENGQAHPGWIKGTPPPFFPTCWGAHP